MRWQRSAWNGETLPRACPLAAIMLVCMLMLTGCGMGEPETPDGFTETEVEGFHLAYPEEWHVTPEGDTAPHFTFTATSDGTSESDYSVGVEVGEEIIGTLQGSVDISVENARLQMDDVKVVSRKPVEVEGAATAIRVHATYTTAQGLNLVNVDLYMQRHSGAFVLLRVVGRQDSADLDLMRQIVDTAYIG